jgi:hypothetical protein
MAMKKREPGFLGLAKQNAKRKGMVKVPRRHNIQGETHYPVFVTAKEMKELKLDGGSGKMTKYGIPSFETEGEYESSFGGGDSSVDSQQSGNQDFGHNVNYGTENRGGYDGGGGGPGMNVQDMGDNSGEERRRKAQQEAAAKAAAAKAKAEAEAAAKKAAAEKKKKEAYEADRKEDYEKKQARETKREGFLDEYKGFQGEAAGLGKDSKALTEGQFTDSEGRVEGDKDFDPNDPEGSVQGGFAGDVKKLGAYEGKFDTLAGEAGTRADAGQDYLQGKVDPVTGERVGGAASDIKNMAATGGADLKALGAGVLTDSEGRVEGDKDFVKEGATMQGGYKQITGAETQAATTKGAGIARGLGEEYKDVTGEGISTATGVGSKEARELAKGYKDIDGQASVDAAAKGSKGFLEGATDVGGVKEQFGKEGFQKDVGGYESQIAGMADKAMSGDVGQREAGMLKGRMEEGRMASQKGSEEKLRREMAQSGASPAEIASKVAQFQRQSANQQAQAGRSETLSSQLQGQQMGQAQLGQAAGLTGQALQALKDKTGIASKAAGLGVTQAELKGKAAGMEMSGADTQTKAKLASLAGAGQQNVTATGLDVAGATAEEKAKLASLAGQSQQNVTATGLDVTGTSAVEKAKLASLGGQGQMIEAGTGMEMGGVKTAADINVQGTKLGMAGADQEAGMLTSAAGAVTAAGDARTKQMGGIDQQSGIIDQQGNYVQAGLASTESDITQASTEEQARLTRAAQGTPDDPRYRPPAPVVENEVSTGLPTGTTIAPGQPVDLPTRAEGGPVQGGKPYIVGEKGRELFTPSQSGNITPNSQMPPSPTEVKQTGDHSFTIAPAEASAPASRGGVNAAPPQLQGAPPQQGMMQQGQPVPSQARMAMEDAQPQVGRMMSEDMMESKAQMVQGGLSSLGQQGGLMGQPSQGNQQQGMMQQQRELTKQMGQAGQVRPSWRDGGGLSGLGQGQAGIAQQGGLMGQNAPMNPNQQQEMEAFHKKRQQMQMQGFGQR